MPGMRGRTSTSFAGSIVPVATTMRSIVAVSTFAVGAGGGGSPPQASAASDSTTARSEAQMREQRDTSFSERGCALRTIARHRPPVRGFFAGGAGSALL